jgi:transcriptional regulator with XRE-family HTH domain
MVNLIRQARQTRGWTTSAKLNAEIRQTARRLGVGTASQESLRVMISGWENGRQTPDATYQRLLRQVFDFPGEALGFPAADPGANDESLAPLVRRGAARIEVTDSVLGYFRRQFAEHMQLDNETGPGLVLDVVGT